MTETNPVEYANIAKSAATNPRFLFFDEDLSYPKEVIESADVQHLRSARAASTEKDPSID